MLSYCVVFLSAIWCSAFFPVYFVPCDLLVFELRWLPAVLCGSTCRRSVKCFADVLYSLHVLFEPCSRDQEGLHPCACDRSVADIHAGCVAVVGCPHMLNCLAWGGSETTTYL